MQFKFGFGNYLIILAIAAIMIVIAIVIIIKNIRKFNLYWIISFVLIIVAILGAKYSKSPCIDNIRHTYALETSYIDKIISSETFNSESVKNRLLKEKVVIHEVSGGDDKYIRSIKGAPEKSYIKIFVLKCDSISEAKKVFYRDKYEYNDDGILMEGSLENGEYFSTFMIQYRADPEGWYVLTNEYSKYLHIRKGNLLIEIIEDSHDGVTEINDWLKILSEV